MASQINNPDNADGKKVEKKAPSKRGVKNPFLYGGTIVILIITVIAFVFIPSIGGGLGSSSAAPKFGSWSGKPITYTAGSYFANQVAQINDYLKQQGFPSKTSNSMPTRYGGWLSRARLSGLASWMPCRKAVSR